MKRIEKTEKIWVPGEEQEPGYEPHCLQVMNLRSTGGSGTDETGAD